MNDVPLSLSGVGYLIISENVQIHTFDDIGG